MTAPASKMRRKRTLDENGNAPVISGGDYSIKLGEVSRARVGSVGLVPVGGATPDRHKGDRHGTVQPPTSTRK